MKRPTGLAVVALCLCPLVLIGLLAATLFQPSVEYTVRSLPLGLFDPLAAYQMGIPSVHPSFTLTLIGSFVIFFLCCGSYRVAANSTEPWKVFSLSIASTLALLVLPYALVLFILVWLLGVRMDVAAVLCASVLAVALWRFPLVRKAVRGGVIAQFLR